MKKTVLTFIKFRISVWGLTDGIETIGNLRTDLALYLGLIWLLIFLAIFRGLGWSAKVRWPRTICLVG